MNFCNSLKYERNASRAYFDECQKNEIYFFNESILQILEFY